MKHRHWILGVLLTIVLLCAAGIAFAAEAQPAPAASPDPARVRDHVVQGEIVAVTADEATVETSEGLVVTLRLGDDTYYWVPGSPPTGTSTLTAGDPVLAFGRPADTREASAVQVLDARVVVVVEPDDIPRYVISGRVVAVTAETLVVRTPRGERAISVLARTRLFSTQGSLESLRDVHRGEQILALGQPTELGQWIAGIVVSSGESVVSSRTLRGEVSAVDVAAGQLEVDTGGGRSITVDVTERTRYRIAGVESPTLADIRPGDRVAVTGRITSTDPPTLTAQGIAVLPDR